jgi:hypothetical protein
MALYLSPVKSPNWMYWKSPKSMKLTASPRSHIFASKPSASCTVYEMLNSHISNAFKVAPPTLPPTIRWNGMMTLNNIFNQSMAMYGKPTPNTMHQNNLNFLTPYNPKDPPKLLFKRCTDCHEIQIIAKV